jgi:hypothetical protein
MDSLITVSSSAMVAGYLVEFVKMAFPNKPSWVSVLAAVLSGIMASFLISLAQDQTLTATTAARLILEGIAAAATAAGLTRTIAAAARV